MAGVSVGGRFCAFDREEIDLRSAKRSEQELLRLLECFSRGEFTRVKILNLVMPLHCTPHFFFLTHAAQNGTKVGDGGAKLIGEGLKINSSLQRLFLVRHFVFDIDLFVAGAMQGEGGEGVGCTHACAAEQKPNRGRRCCRVGRGAESQQQPAGALSCKAFCFCS